MKILFLCAMFCLPPGGDRERGLQLYRDGRYADAAAAFRDAIANEGDSAELQYNLALALWRAGMLPDAETAVEKYAAMAGAPRIELHRGVLGAVRFDEAKALQQRGEGLLTASSAQPPGGAAEPPAEDPLAVFEQALGKAVQSKEHFVRAAAAAPSPELLRNTERALRLVDELQKKVDELKAQREQQKKDQEQKDSEQKDDKESKDDKEKQKDQQKQEQKGDPEQDPKQGEGKPDEPPPEGEPGEGKPEPKPEQAPEPKPGEGEPTQAPQPPQPPTKPEPGEPDEQKSPEVPPAPDQPEPQPRTDAPGEVPKGKELSPEQTQRLLEQARELDRKLQQIRARASKSARRGVERDW